MTRAFLGLSQRAAARLCVLVLLAVVSALPLHQGEARADDRALVHFVVPAGSTVFFANVLSSLESGESAGYRIRAWDDGQQRRALISEESFEGSSWDDSLFRRFDEANGSDVTITVSDDFLTATLEAEFPKIGSVAASLRLLYGGAAKTFWEQCHVLAEDEWQLVSPSVQLGSSVAMAAGGSIDGRAIVNSHPCKTYGHDAAGYGYIAGPKL